VTITEEIEAFILKHRDHGQLVGDAAEPGSAGYEVTITCPCRTVFMRWVTPGEASIDLAAWRDTTEMDRQRSRRPGIVGVRNEPRFRPRSGRR
jgi:hypothetical protein